MNIVNTKQYNDLIKIIKEGHINHDFERKEKFKRKSLIFLRKMAKDLNLTEVSISFNPLGIAVSGETNLMGMWNEGNGIYVNLSDDTFLFRTIKNMEDYTGGHNNFIYSSWNSNYNCSYEDILNKILKLNKR